MPLMLLLLLLLLLLRLVFGLSVWQGTSHKIRVPGNQSQTSHNIL